MRATTDGNRSATITTRRVTIVANVLFCAGLFLPFVQKVTHLFPDLTLSGVERRAPRPELSASSWFDGTFSRRFEAYFEGRIGFRGCFVRVYNQLNLSLFGELPKRAGTQVLVGKDHWLYERAYVSDYLRPAGMPPSTAEDFATRLAELQTLLGEAGIAFVFVISPSKAELMPEYLPSELTRAAPSAVRSARDVLTVALNRHGVRYVDAHAFFKRIKAHSEPLFAPGGTHWNYYGSFLVWRELVRVLRDSVGVSWPVPELAGIEHHGPLGTDNDLAKLLNVLWMYSEGDTRIPYPIVRADTPAQPDRPAVLVVGDSFAFTLIDSIRYSRVNSDLDLLYYYKRRFTYPSDDTRNCVSDHISAEVGPLDPGTIDWPNVLLSKQLVILETNEILLRKRGWGFVEDAIAFLRAQRAPALRTPTPQPPR